MSNKIHKQVSDCLSSLELIEPDRVFHDPFVMSAIVNIVNRPNMQEMSLDA